MNTVYAPNGSNYHDHLCNCPGCNYDGEAEIQEMEQAMQESIIIPVLDPVKHTSEKLFCDDWDCPCHQDIENVNALTEQVEAGLLTTVEANMILRGATI